MGMAVRQWSETRWSELEVERIWWKQSLIRLTPIESSQTSGFGNSGDPLNRDYLNDQVTNKRRIREQSLNEELTLLATWLVQNVFSAFEAEKPESTRGHVHLWIRLVALQDANKTLDHTRISQSLLIVVVGRQFVDRPDQLPHAWDARGVPIRCWPPFDQTWQRAWNPLECLTIGKIVILFILRC